MKNKIWILSALFFSFGFAQAQAESKNTFEWLSQVSGQYSGKIWSAGETLTVMTSFSSNQNGGIEGKYEMNETDRVVPGKLSDCHDIGKRKLQCDWKDIYGTGALTIKFSADFSKFNGKWNAESEKGKHFWNGAKPKK